MLTVNQSHTINISVENLISQPTFYLQIPHHVKMFIMAGLLFGIPCPLILTFNWLTVRALKQMSSTLQSNVQSTFLSKAEWSITFMIIVASVVFIVLNAPLFVTCLMWFLMEISDQMHNELVHSKVDDEHM